METLGDRLQIIRGNDSRRSFAELLGIKESTLRNYEQGVTLPNSDFIAEFCKKMRIAIEWFVVGSGSMRPEESAQPAANAPELPVNTPETAGCARCAKMEAELEREREERRELTQENRNLSTELREINAENRRMAKENRELSVDNGVLREQIRKLSGKSVAADCA